MLDSEMEGLLRISCGKRERATLKMQSMTLTVLSIRTLKNIKPVYKAESAS